MQREPGFYWVKYVGDTEWSVVQYNKHGFFDGSEYGGPLPDSDFADIRQRVPEPDEAVVAMPVRAAIYFAGVVNLGQMEAYRKRGLGDISGGGHGGLTWCWNAPAVQALSDDEALTLWQYVRPVISEWREQRPNNTTNSAANRPT